MARERCARSACGGGAGGLGIAGPAPRTLRPLDCMPGPIFCKPLGGHSGRGEGDRAPWTSCQGWGQAEVTMWRGTPAHVTSVQGKGWLAFPVSWPMEKCFPHIIRTPETVIHCAFNELHPSIRTADPRAVAAQRSPPGVLMRMYVGLALLGPSTRHELLHKQVSYHRIETHSERSALSRCFRGDGG